MFTVKISVRFVVVTALVVLASVVGVLPAHALPQAETAKPRVTGETQRLYRPAVGNVRDAEVKLYRPRERQLQQLDQLVAKEHLRGRKKMEALKPQMLALLDQGDTLHLRVRDVSGLPVFHWRTAGGRFVEGNAKGYGLVIARPTVHDHHRPLEERPIPNTGGGLKLQELGDVVPDSYSKRRLGPAVLQVKFQDNVNGYVTEQRMVDHVDLAIRNTEGRTGQVATIFTQSGTETRSDADALRIEQRSNGMGHDQGQAELVTVDYHANGRVTELVAGGAGRYPRRSLGVPELSIMVEAGRTNRNPAGLDLLAVFRQPNKLHALEFRTAGLVHHLTELATPDAMNRMAGALFDQFWVHDGRKSGVDPAFVADLVQERPRVVAWERGADSVLKRSPMTEAQVSALTKMAFGVDLLNETFDTNDVLHRAIDMSTTGRLLRPATIFGKQALETSAMAVIE